MLKITTLLIAATLATHAAEGAGHHQRGEMRDRVLAKCDTDQDGKLSDAERTAALAALTARLQEKHPQLLARIDTSGDGRISVDEFRAARQLLRERRQQHGKGQ